MRRLGRRVLSLSLTTLYLVGNVALGHAAESNLWAERRRQTRTVASAPAPTLARLPAGLLPEMPLRATRLTRPEEASPALPDVAPALRALVAALPSTRVRVTDTWAPPGQGASAAPVVILQDVHLNAEAQGNLAAALGGAVAAGGVTFVGVEGAFAPFDFNAFHAFPDTPALRGLLQRLLDAGRIAAPVLVGLTTATKAVFGGVDDRPAYIDNVRAYLAADAARPDLEKSLNGVMSDWRQARARALRPDLARFAERRAAFADGSLALPAYADALARLGAAPDAAMTRYLTACRLEAALDWTRVERERNDALRVLTEKMSAADVDGLIREATAFRDGRLTLADFYRRLTRRFAGAGVSLDSRPALRAYLDYALLADGISPSEVLKSLDRWEADTVARLAPTAAEADALALDAHLSLVKKLLAFALTPEEWARYQTSAAQRATWRTEPTAGAVASLSAVTRALAPFETFYRAADRRTEVMVKRLLRGGSGPRALVVGGFHTAAVEALLRAAGVPHVTVAPRLTKVDLGSATAYLSIFQREKESLDRLFAGRTLFLSPVTVAAIFTHDPSVVAKEREIGALAAAVSAPAGGTVAGYTVTPGKNGRARVDNDTRDVHAEVDAAALTVAPVGAPASLFDRAARAAWGRSSAAYARFTGWIAPLLETPLFALAFAGATTLLQAAGLTAFVPGSALALTAIALALAHAATNRDWRLASLGWWTIGALVLVAPFAMMPAFPATLTSAALHLLWNRGYLSGWLAVPMSLFGYKAPDLGPTVASLLEARRGMVFTDSADAVDAALAEEAARTKTPYLRVVLRNRSDLERLTVRFIANPDGTYTMPPGPLPQLLADGGILFIDYGGSDPKLVESFNSLFDRAPYYAGKPVSPNLRIVGAVRDADLKKYPVSFYSRFRRVLSLRERFSDPVDQIPWTDGETEGTTVELFQSPIVREPLLGHYRLGEDGGVRFEPGALAAAIKTGTLVIRGGDWADPGLRELVRDLIVKRTVEINGETITLPENFRLLRQTGLYGRRPLTDKRLVAPGEGADAGPAFVINKETQDRLFSITEATEGGALVQRPGLLDRPTVRLRITEEVPDWVWHRILHSDAKVAVEVDPGVPVPEEYRRLRGAARPQAPAAPAVSEIAGRGALLVRASDPDFARDQVRQALPGREVVSIAVSPGLQYDDLVSGIDVRTAGGRRSFRAFEGPLLTALRAGKVVVLTEADANPALLRRFQSALLDDGYLTTYAPTGTRTDGAPGEVRLSDLPGKLVIVARGTDGVAPGLPAAVAEPTEAELGAALERWAAEKRARDAARQSETGQPARAVRVSPADVARLMTLRRLFNDAVDSGLLKERPRFNLARLGMLLDYEGDWLTAFDRVMIQEQEDNPEGAAYMRTMVRLVFGVDDPGQTRDAFAANKLRAALDALHAGASFDSVVWRLADALGLDALRDPAFGLGDFDARHPPAGVVALAGRSLVRYGPPAKADYYRSYFQLTDDAAPAPRLDTKTTVGETTVAARQADVTDLLKRFHAVFLRGPPGSGKSYMAEQIARSLGEVHGPFTTGPDVSEVDVLGGRRLVGEETRFVPGRIGAWAERGGVLIIDEANLMKPDFWNFLSGYLNAEHPNHYVIFTGNQESLPGRSAQKFIQDHAVTVPFRDFDDAFLKRQFADLFDGRGKRDALDVPPLLFDLFDMFRKVGRGRSFSMRDVQELAARASLLTSENWTRADMIGLTWRLYAGLYSPAERMALRHLLMRRYGVDVADLQRVKREEMRRTYGGVFRAAGLAPVDSALDSIAVIEDFLRMRKARLGGKSLLQGKRGLIIEGPSGRGKDVILDPMLENDGVRRDGVGTSRYDRVTASLDFEALVALIQRAQEQGGVDIVSELNLLPSALLEGRLNDLLTGNAREGFAFIATINSTEFSGRETLSSALQNRVVYRRETDYTQNELLTIAETEATRLGGDVEALRPALALAVNAHVWIRDGIGDSRYNPTTREIIDLTARIVAARATPASVMGLLNDVYGPLYLDHILHRPLPSAATLSGYTEKPSLDPFEGLTVIGRTQINRPDMPFTVGPDASDPRQSGGYYQSSRNRVALRSAGLAQPESVWLRVFFHEISHGLFTRDLAETPGGRDPFDPLYQCLEDVRHQAAFTKFFPATVLNPTSQMEADMLERLFDPEAFRSWMDANQVSPRRLFQYLTVAIGKGLITREALTAAAQIMQGRIAGDPFSVALRHFDGAVAVSREVPDDLSEDEIRYRQYRGLRLMLDMKNDYLTLDTRVEERRAVPTVEKQREEAEAVVEKVRSRELSPGLSEAKAPPAVVVPDAAEIARRRQNAERDAAVVAAAERDAVRAELKQMEKDLRAGADAGRLAEIEAQLTDPGHPVSLVAKLARGDDALRRSAARVLAMTRNAREGRPPASPLLARLTPAFVALADAFRTATAPVRAQPFRVAAAVAGAAIFVAVATALAQTDVAAALSYLGDLLAPLLTLRALVLLLLFAAVFAAMFAALMWLLPRFLFRVQGEAGVAAPGTGPRYSNVVAHDEDSGENNQVMDVAPLRPETPEPWRPEQVSPTFRDFARAEAAALDAALESFWQRRLQASRTYGREGTLDPVRIITDPANPFVRIGGVEERVRTQVVVRHPSYEQLSGGASAALAHLVERGFTVRVVAADESGDGAVSELERQGPVTVVSSEELDKMVEPVFLHAAMNAALAGARLPAPPKAAPVEPADETRSQVRELAEEALRRAGVADAAERARRIRVTGTGPNTRLELSLHGTRFSDLSAIYPLARYLTRLDIDETAVRDIKALSHFPYLRVVQFPLTTPSEDIADLIFDHSAGPFLKVTVAGMVFSFLDVDAAHVNRRLAEPTLSADAKKLYLAYQLRSAAIRSGNDDNGRLYVNREKNDVDVTGVPGFDLAALAPHTWIQRLAMNRLTAADAEALLKLPNLETVYVRGGAAADDAAINRLFSAHPNRERLEVLVTAFDGVEIWRWNWLTGKLANTTPGLQYELARRALPKPRVVTQADKVAGMPDAVEQLGGMLEIRTDEPLGFWPSVRALTRQQTAVAGEIAALAPFTQLRTLTLLRGAILYDELLQVPSLAHVNVGETMDRDEMERIVANHPNPEFSMEDAAGNLVTKALLPAKYRRSGEDDPDNPLSFDEQMNEVRRISARNGGNAVNGWSRTRRGYEVTLDGSTINGAERLTDVESVVLENVVGDLSPLEGLPKLETLSLPELAPTTDPSRLPHLRLLIIQSDPGVEAVRRIFLAHPNAEHLTVGVAAGGKSYTLSDFPDVQSAVAAAAREAQIADLTDLIRRRGAEAEPIDGPRNEAGLFGAHVSFADLSGMERLSDLQFLTVNAPNPNLTPLEALPNLRDLVLLAPADIQAVVRLRGLASLRLGFTPSREALRTLLENHPNRKLAIYTPGRLSPTTRVSLAAEAPTSAEEQLAEMNASLLGFDAELGADGTITVRLKTGLTDGLERFPAIGRVEFENVKDIQPEGLRPLPNLHTIVLNNSPIPLGRLETLPHLESIVLQNTTSPTMAQMAEFLRALPRGDTAEIQLASGERVSAATVPADVMNAAAQEVHLLTEEVARLSALLETRGGGRVTTLPDGGLSVEMRSSDLSGLGAYRGIAKIEILGGVSRPDWSQVATLPRLESITLHNTELRLTGLLALRHLNHLALNGTFTTSVDEIQDFLTRHENGANLVVVLNGSEVLTRNRGSEHAGVWPAVTPEVEARVRAELIQAESVIAEELVAQRAADHVVAGRVETTPTRLSVTAHFDDLSGFDRLTQLTDLTIRGRPSTLGPLARLNRLKRLRVEGELAWGEVVSLRNLEVLEVVGTPDRVKLATLLAAHPNRHRLRISITDGGTTEDLFLIDVDEHLRGPRRNTLVPGAVSRTAESQKSLLEMLIMENSPRGASYEADVVGDNLEAKIPSSDVSGFQSITKLRSLEIANEPDIDLSPLIHLPELTNLTLNKPILLRQLVRLEHLERLTLNYEANDEEIFELLENHPNRDALKVILLHEGKPVELNIRVAAMFKARVLADARKRERDAAGQGLSNTLGQREMFELRSRLADLWNGPMPAGEVVTLTPRDTLEVRAKTDQLGPIAAFSTIESLDLTGSPVSQLEPLFKMPQLRRLNLTDTQVRDPVQLLALTGLTELIVDTRVMDANLAEVLSHHPNAGRLRLFDQDGRAIQIPRIERKPLAVNLEDITRIGEMLKNLVDTGAALTAVRRRFAERGELALAEALLAEVRRTYDAWARNEAPRPGWPVFAPLNPGQAPGVYGKFSMSQAGPRVEVPDNPLGRDLARLALTGRRSVAVRRLISLLGGRAMSDLRLRELRGTPTAAAFSLAVARDDFDRSGLLESAAAAARAENLSRKPSEADLFDGLMGAVADAAPAVPLNTAISPAAEDKKPLIFVIRGPEDEEKARAVMRVRKDRTVVMVGARDITGADGRVSLKMLDAAVRASLPAGLANAYLLLPEGVAFTPDIDEATLRSMVIGILDELLNVRVMEGRTVDNILKTARIIAMNA